MFRDVMNIGASPKSEIYRFNDPKVAQTHTTTLIGKALEPLAGGQGEILVLLSLQ